MARKQLVFVVAFAVLVCANGVVSADDPQDTFTTLFGADHARAAKSADKRVRGELAGKMVKVAGGTNVDGPLVAVLCEKALGLIGYEAVAAGPTTRPAGADTAEGGRATPPSPQPSPLKGEGESTAEGGRATPPSPFLPLPRGEGYTEYAGVALDAYALLIKANPERKAEYLGRRVEILGRQVKTLAGAERESAGVSLVEAHVALAEAKLAGKDYDGASACLRQAVALAAQFAPNDLPTIKAKQDAVTAAKAIATRAELLAKRLAANPKDAAARAELVRLYLVDLDSPADAGKFVLADDEGEQAGKIRLASQNLAGLPALASMEMANWYRELAGGAAISPSPNLPLQGGGVSGAAVSSAARVAMLRRARDYCERFLKLYTTEDVTRAKAKADLDEIAAAMAAVEAKKGGPAGGALGKLGTIDLLALAKPEQASPGKWTREGKAIRVEPTGAAAAGMCKLVFPVRVEGDYDLGIEAVRTGAREALLIGLPVGKAGVTVLIDLNNNSPVTQLALVDGKRITTPQRGWLFGDGQLHTILAKVRTKDDTATVTVSVDGAGLLKWEGKMSSLAPAADFVPGDVANPCIGTWATGFVFRQAAIKMVSGRAEKGSEAN